MVAQAKASPSKIDGEMAARRIIAEWKGSSLPELNSAAFQLGLLQSIGSLKRSRCAYFLDFHMGIKGYASSLLSFSRACLDSGCSVVLSEEEAQRIFSTPANDNVRQRFDVTWCRDILADKAKQWTVRGVFGRGEFASVYGKPGTGKSVLVTDAAFHVAANMPWHGRKVAHGLVVYFAAERKSITERRIAALRKKYQVGDIPLVVVGGKLDMTRGLGDAIELSKLISSLELECGLPCVWVIIDTLSRTFGGGDQNASKDMGKFVQSADEIIRQTGALLTVVHHTPWNEDRGKGAIDLDGAVDASFLLSKSGKTFLFRCDGANDGEEGKILAFTLETVEIGTDEEGTPITAPVLVAVEGNVAGLYGDEAETFKPTGQDAVALQILRELIDVDGECPPLDSPGFPEGVKTARRSTWQEKYCAISKPSDKLDTVLRRFRRAVSNLLEKGLVRQTGEWVWLPDKRTCPDILRICPGHLGGHVRTPPYRGVRLSAAFEF